MLSKGPTNDFNDSVSRAEKKFSINSSNAKTKFCSSLHYNGDDSDLFVTRKEIYKFKALIKMSTFQLSFV